MHIYIYIYINTIRYKQIYTYIQIYSKVGELSRV